MKQLNLFGETKEKIVQKKPRRALDIKYSGRSSDYITPSFGFGCLYKCAYCYMRRHKPNGLSIANNTDDILNVITLHSSKLGNKFPNQTHETLWTYDISCNEDFALHAKYHEWEKIFDYFKNSDKLMATFATKNVNRQLLNYNPERKVRIRFSLMPQEYSDILEPDTTKIIDRIKAVNDFYDAGYDVHLNFSPVIIHKKSYKLYHDLFHLVNDNIRDDIKKDIKAEVIMMTHSEKMHVHNLTENPEAEELLWQPGIQELKKGSYQKVANILRYKWQYKEKQVQGFRNLHNSIIPWNKIRYIF